MQIKSGSGNRKSFFILFLLAAFCFSYANAQNNDQGSIISELQKDKPNEGKIRIRSDAGISALIGSSTPGANSTSSDFIKTSGYRINIYSGNNPKQSKEEAFSKERQIKGLYPDLQTYVTYDSPIWRLRVGDFESSEEATLFMQELKKELPALSKEMYVVSDEVKVGLVN